MGIVRLRRRELSTMAKVATWLPSIRWRVSPWNKRQVSSSLPKGRAEPKWRWFQRSKFWLRRKKFPEMRTTQRVQLPYILRITMLPEHWAGTVPASSRKWALRWLNWVGMTIDDSVNSESPWSQLGKIWRELSPELGCKWWLGIRR